MTKSPNESSGKNLRKPLLGSGDRDVSPAPGALDERDQLIAELEEAIRRRDDFLAVAAHELRNPLTPILLCVQYIRSAEVAGNHAQAISELDRLQRLVKRFAARTNMLLEVSQIASNKLQLDITELNLSELVQGVVEDHKPLIERSGSKLQTTIQQSVVAFADRMAVSEIVENLLSNAIKYGRQKPISLSLTGTVDAVQIVVQDEGIGINEKDQARIFERFERAVGKEVQAGFGIGLWLTRNLAQQMGGSIDVVGELGVGSTFTVTLPVRPQEKNG